MSDFALARNKMVDGQIRPVRVNDPRIILAMRALPRERFVPPSLAGLAYIDTPIELGGGRTVTEPRVLARLVQLAAPRRGERALVLGANTGYGAALLASLDLDVVAVEEDAALLAIATAACASSQLHVIFHHGRPAEGLPDELPFDVVLVEGGVEIIPPALERLVALGRGRLVAVMREGGVWQGMVAERSQDGLRARPHFDAAARLLPGFARPAGFRF